MKARVNLKNLLILSICSSLVSAHLCSAFGLSPTTLEFDNVKAGMSVSSEFQLSRGEAYKESHYEIETTGDLEENLSVANDLTLAEGVYSQMIPFHVDATGLNPGSYETTILVKTEAATGYFVGIPFTVIINVSEEDVLSYEVKYVQASMDQESNTPSFTAFVENSGNQTFKIDALKLKITDQTGAIVDEVLTYLNEAIEVPPFSKESITLKSEYSFKKYGLYNLDLSLISENEVLFEEKDLVLQAIISDSLRVWIKRIGALLLVALSIYLLRKNQHEKTR